VSTPETPRTWTETVNGGDVREGDTIWLETRWVTVMELYPAPDHIGYGYHDGTRGWAGSFLVDTPILRACVVAAVDAERERLLDLLGDLEALLSSSVELAEGDDCNVDAARDLLREYGRLGHRRPGA
jgi:hypothetical protein